MRRFGLRTSGNEPVKTMRHSILVKRAQGAARAAPLAQARGRSPRFRVNCKEGFVTWFN